MRSVFFAAVMLAALPAQAADLTMVLKGPDGTVFKDNFAADAPKCERTSEVSCKPDLTLGRVIYNALIIGDMADQSNRNATVQQKFRRGELAKQVYSSKEMDFTAEDTAIIKEAIGKLYGPAVVYEAVLAIDPAMKSK